MRFLTLTIVGLTLVLAFTLDTDQARSTGINGFSGNPATTGGLICIACHSGGITPTVTLSGPQTVTPGSTNRYMLSISGGQQIAGGLDVSVTDGTLANIDEETYILFEELTHRAPREADAFGTVTFEFDWTAPASTGKVTMYGAGNSVDLLSGSGGDAPNNDILSITVQGAPSTPGETSGAGLPQMKVTEYDSFLSAVTVEYETGCDTVDNNVYFGPLADVSLYGYTGQVCDLGANGITSFALPEGSYFFIIVGDDDAVEGSYGPDGALTERPASGACGLTQDLDNTCAQP